MPQVTRLMKRATSLRLSTYVGPLGEVIFDKDIKTLVLQDGVTTGGVPLAKAVHGHSDATTGDAGFMSASDKTKLNGLPSSIYYQSVQYLGNAQSLRNSLNFSADISAVDDPSNNRTNVSLVASGITPGTYTKITFDSKGRATVGQSLVASDIPQLPTSKIDALSNFVVGTKLNEFQSPDASVAFNNQRLTGIAEPVADNDAATKQYVQSLAAGLNFKESCRVASIANVSVSSPGTTIDGVVLANNDRILLKNQSTASQNGIYTFNGASSPLTRALDADANGEVKTGIFTYVSEGVVNARISFVLATTGTITVGITALSFVEFNAAPVLTPGNGIVKSGSLVSVDNGADFVFQSNQLTLSNTITAGTYNSITVDAKGRAVAGNVVNTQPNHPLLTSLSNASTNGFLVKTGSGAIGVRLLTSSGTVLVTNPDGVGGNTSFEVAPDTTQQKVKISKNGVPLSTRTELNFIESSSSRLVMSDDNTNNKTDISIESKARPNNPVGSITAVGGEIHFDTLGIWVGQVDGSWKRILYEV